MAKFARRGLVFLWALAGLPTVAVAASESAQVSRSDDIVWHWYSDCAAPVTMKLEVVQRGDLIFATTFPMCQLRRDEIRAEAGRRQIIFPISDERLRLFGLPAKSQFDVEISEQVMASGGVTLGVSFVNAGKVAFSGALVADPAAAAELKPAAGVLLRLLPLQH